MPGRVRGTINKWSPSARIRAGIVAGGVIAVVVAGAVIALSSTSGRPGRPLHSDALATQFGPRLNCERLSVVSPHGTYARIDLDRAGPCGVFGNQETLILHLVHGVWLREFEGPSWTCPMSRLPQPVAIELQLCRPKRGAAPTVGALSDRRRESASPN